MLIWFHPSAAEVQASLSRDTTSLDEPVGLQLLIKGANDAAPDLSVLNQDFEILGRSTRQNVSVINGQMSKTRGLNLTLLPKKSGRLIVPAIAVGSESSSPLVLEVTDVTYPTEDAEQANDVFMHLAVDKKQTYPQEEILLTVRLYQAEGVWGESVSEPRASLDDTSLKLLYENQYQEEHEGRPYRVIERRYAVYANHPGKLSLGDIHYRGRSVPAGSAPFDPQQQGRIIRTKSAQLEVEILPIPAAFTGQHWLPARNLRIVERDLTGKGPILAGKPFSRQILLLADGLSAAQLPSIDLEPPVGLKQYPERPQLNDQVSRQGVIGSLQTNLTLVAAQAGDYTLPAIEIPWWNTQTHRQELARLPEVGLEIQPDPGSSSSFAPYSTELVPSMPPVQTTTPKIDHRAIPGEPEANGFPTWLAWILGIGWLATLAAWWNSRHRKRPVQSRPPQPVTPVVAQNPLPGIIDDLESAYRNNDREAARVAWLHWGEYRWPERAPGNLNRLASRCHHNIALAVSLLDRAFYSPGSSDEWRQFDPRELLEPVREAETRSGQRQEAIPSSP